MPDFPETQWGVRFDRTDGWHVSVTDSEHRAREWAEWAATETERGRKATVVSRTITYSEWESASD